MLITVKNVTDSPPVYTKTPLIIMPDDFENGTGSASKSFHFLKIHAIESTLQILNDSNSSQKRKDQSIFVIFLPLLPALGV